jgi:hypothetical protein
VPHRFYRHITADTYRDVVRGKTNLLVAIRLRQRDRRRPALLSGARHSYDHIGDVFYSQGGSLDCDDVTDPASATDSTATASPSKIEGTGWPKYRLYPWLASYGVMFGSAYG